MISKTYPSFFCVFLCFFLNISFSFAQEKTVEIIEEKATKKIDLYAQNHTDTAKEVFLKVEGTGLRKSGFRPIIKKVPAHSKVLMITLIPLKNVTPNYTYLTSFDDVLETINAKTPKFKHWKALNNVIDKGETIIFTKDECTKCEKLIGMLKANKIKHKEFNISKHKRYEDFFWKTVSKFKRKDVYISSIPIAIVAKEFYEGIDLIAFAEMLKK